MTSKLAYEDFDFWVRSSRIFKYKFLNEKLTRMCGGFNNRYRLARTGMAISNYIQPIWFAGRHWT